MGGEFFTTQATGIIAADAFSEAVSRAQYECGHGGYTGTIAEKREFRLFHVPEGMSLDEFIDLTQSPESMRSRVVPLSDKVQAYIKDCAKVVNDKWGPCGCVQLPSGESIKTTDEKMPKNTYVFYGWASS